MKKYILLVFLPLVLALASCCKKVNCDEKNWATIHFHKFSTADLAEVYVTGYEVGTNFTKVQQARMLSTVSSEMNYDSSVTLIVTNKPGLFPDMDWEVTIPALGRSYHISDYKFVNTVCGRCGFSKGVQMVDLDSCRLDGEERKASPLDIYK